MYQSEEGSEEPTMRDDQKREISWSAKPLELNYPKELDNIMSTEDNAVVYFYKPGCPYCAEFRPVYETLANDVHRTNLNRGAVPIVMAQMDGHRWKDAINRLRPGFLGDPVNGRGYPTILFKRGDGKALTWDPRHPRTDYNIAGLMSSFYGDETLMPITQELHSVMNNPDPEYVYFYSDNTAVVPRFVQEPDPNFVDRESAVKTLNYLFLLNDDLRSRGAAFPVNRMDRPDLRIPSIFDRRDGHEYAFRDSHRWAMRELDRSRQRTTEMLKQMGIQEE
jgi:thiol-disulfide isomerase/thioredoxin